MRQNSILQPDGLITSMGTEIYYGSDLIKDTAWTNHLNYHWNRQQIVNLLRELSRLTLQSKERQSTYKISYYYDGSIAPSVDEIKRILHQNEQTANVIFSFGQLFEALY